MMSSDDDDAEPQLKAVENYYFVDDDGAPISFGVLPVQLDAADEVSPIEKDVYLQGFADGGLQKVYKQVVAWKLCLAGRSPEIMVLSTDGSWIALLKPRPSYEETIRSVLITVEMLHFLRRRPTDSEKNIWDHLQGVFDKFAVRPSEDDFRNHQLLIKMFAERDPSLTNSQILQGFIKDKAVEKTDEIGLENLEAKQRSTLGNEDTEEMAEDDSNHGPNNDDDEDDEEEEDLFDSVCAICDNGGELLCCEGPCMRSFHAKIDDGEDSYCATLGYTKAEVKEIQNFLCKNCEHKKHQCFVCGELGSSDGPNAKVFLCNNATCGHFYHPKCVVQLLHPDNRNEASELEKKIVAGFSFTCPVHWCFHCKGLEDRAKEPLQFAVCRRCPKSYHRKCLPREISFEEIEERGIITRAWELSKRILIYCLDHDIDLDIGTPSRDHIKFPPVEKPTNSIKKKVKELAEKKKRTFNGSYVDEPVKKTAKFPDKFIADDSEKARGAGMKSSFKHAISEPVKKRAKYQQETSQLKSCLVECAGDASSPKQPGKEQEQELGTLSSPLGGKSLLSSFPVVDSETEKRVQALIEKENFSVTLDDVSRRCVIPSTYASSGRQIDKIIALGKLERAVQAVHAALQKLENGGTVDDAKAVCEPEVLRQLTRWNNKFRVYLAPFIHGMRYTSFGRHFTKKEKLIEIVDRLHWYVQPGDTIVDFSCGLNDFSQFMKEKLAKVGKRCNFNNYDVIQPKNSFCFEKRDWMSVHPKELPHGSKLIIGLNPPFGARAILANKFINKALTFKPKLIILIVPKDAERLDKKRQPYDLVWEDNHILCGKSFYLPGSLDVSDKQIDQWNASPPPLYLWSRSDYTNKHRKIAEEHGHTEALKAHANQELDYLSGELSTQNYGEVTNELKSTSGKGKGRYMVENKTFVTGKPKQVNRFPSEKQVEIAYEVTKVASGKSGSYRADDRGVHEQRDAHSEFKVSSNSDSREVLDILNGSKGSKSDKTGGYDAKGDSDMSISPSDPRNSQQKSRRYSPPMPSEMEYSSERMALNDNNYLNNRVPEPCVAPLERAPYDDNCVRNVDEYGVTSVENHFFSTDNVDAGDPTDRSFFRSQNFEDYSMNYTMDSAAASYQRNLVPGRDLQNAMTYSEHIMNDNSQAATATDIRAQIRMYGGQTRDDHPQAAMDPPARDIRAQIRMYGGQSIHDHHSQTSRFYSGSLDARFEESPSSTYGIPRFGSAGRSAIDKYTPNLDETNYTADPRDTYNAPFFRRGMPPDLGTGNFASSKQHPYPHPGSGGWLD